MIRDRKIISGTVKRSDTRAADQIQKSLYCFNPKLSRQVSLRMSSCGQDGVDCSGVVDVVASSGTMVDVFPRRWASDVKAEMLKQWRIVPVELKLEELSSRTLE